MTLIVQISQSLLSNVDSDVARMLLLLLLLLLVKHLLLHYLMGIRGVLQGCRRLLARSADLLLLEHGALLLLMLARWPVYRLPVYRKARDRDYVLQLILLVRFVRRVLADRKLLRDLYLAVGPSLIRRRSDTRCRNGDSAALRRRQRRRMIRVDRHKRRGPGRTLTQIRYYQRTTAYEILRSQRIQTRRRFYARRRC